MGIQPSAIGAQAGYPDLEKMWVRNETGTAIPKGSIVYLSGTTAAGEKTMPLVTLADADADGGANRRLKIALSDIGNDDRGQVADWMYFTPSSALGAVGDSLYLSATPGGVVATAPASGVKVRVGTVERIGSSPQFYLDVSGALSDLEDGDGGALGVGESRLIALDYVHDAGAGGNTVTTVPSGQVWVASFGVTDITETFDGSGTLNIGDASDTDGIIATADVTEGTVGEYLSDRRYLVDASAGDVDVIVTQGGTPTQGEATISIFFTRIK